MSLIGLWHLLKGRSTLSIHEAADVEDHDARMHDFDAALKAAEARRRKALARIAAADRKYRAYTRGARA
jgi:hypothetical protein